jgi:hypothetical protein
VIKSQELAIAEPLPRMYLVETLAACWRGASRPDQSAGRLRISHSRDGRGTTRATAAIALPGLENSYAQFAHIHLGNHGIVD